MICSDAVLVRLEVGDELHELVGLPVEVEPVERLQREGRVAHPRVAVVPVALPAGCLGQRRRQRRDGRAGRHVGQPLDRERRALDRLAPAVVGDPRPPEPGAPEARRGGDPRLGLVDVLRAPRAPRPRRGRSTRARRRSSTWRARTRLPSMPSARSETGAGSSGRRRSRRPRAGSRPRAPTRPACGRSRRPARRPVRSRRCPRGTRPCARACGRRRRRRAAACAG